MDMHTSLRFERPEYEIVELACMKMLHIYNTMSDKALSNVEDLFENCHDLAKNEFPLVGIYMNDPKLSLAEVDSVMPYAFGVILDETQPQIKKNFPIKVFEAGKYAKIPFDPSKNDLEEFIQKIYTTFYKTNAYESTIMPILQFHHTSRENYLEDFAQSSDFFIFIAS
jgi:DNA gyrase inhibitor GyrI